MTKNWQTVNRRNVSGQTVPKSWPGHRKRPYTNSRATNWRDEKMHGWMMKNHVSEARMSLRVDEHVDDRLGTSESRVNGPRYSGALP